MEIQMSFSQDISQELILDQRLRLQAIIEKVDLIALPDSLLDSVVGAIVYNPSEIEKNLSNKQNKGAQREGACDTVSQIRSIYSGFNPQQGINNTKGMILSPNISDLKDFLSLPEEMITPDVTYIGKRNQKPELILSDHLKGYQMKLLPNLDSSEFPKTSKLVKKLRDFDLWKRDTLKEGYINIGNTQREFFEDFDKTRLNILSPENLGGDLGLHETTIYRIFSNRWIDARNVEGEKIFMPSKDLLVTRNQLKKYLTTPQLNEILKQEFKEGIAFSDQEISIKVLGLARRTMTKYRTLSNVPSYKRQEMYDKKERDNPYEI